MKAILKVSSINHNRMKDMIDEKMHKNTSNIELITSNKSSTQSLPLLNILNKVKEKSNAPSISSKSIIKGSLPDISTSHIEERKSNKNEENPIIHSKSPEKQKKTIMPELFQSGYFNLNDSSTQNLNDLPQERIHSRSVFTKKPKKMEIDQSPVVPQNAPINTGSPVKQHELSSYSSSISAIGKNRSMTFKSSGGVNNRSSSLFRKSMIDKSQKFKIVDDSSRSNKTLISNISKKIRESVHVEKNPQQFILKEFKSIFSKHMKTEKMEVKDLIYKLDKIYSILNIPPT